MGVCFLLDHEFAFISPGGSGWHYQRTALICTVHIDDAVPMIWIRAASTCRYSADMADAIEIDIAVVVREVTTTVARSLYLRFLKAFAIPFLPVCACIIQLVWL